MKSITKFLFVVTQLSALFWVNWSYAIATYATIELGQPYPLETLSTQAIITVLGVLGLKVMENALEHNNGSFWGQSDTTKITESDKSKEENHNEHC